MFAFRILFDIAAMIELSTPPERKHPKGTSDLNLSFTELIKFSKLYLLFCVLFFLAKYHLFFAKVFSFKSILIFSPGFNEKMFFKKCMIRSISHA